MMRKIILQALLYLFVFLFVFPFAPPAFAHGGDPRLEISLERINPGGVIELRGVDFDYDEIVALSLMRSDIQIPLLETTADGEGMFTQVIALPADLPPGKYNVRARSEHHLVMSPTIIVWGAAVEDQENNSVQDQSDLELGPVPTFAPNVSSTPVPLPQTNALATPVAKESRSLPIYWVFVGIGILALLGLRMLKKR